MAPTSGVWPRDGARPTRSYGELRVYDALRSGLPEGWLAWHSLRIRDKRGYLGEGDFVLAHPTRGLLALEVKAGHVEQRDGRWYSNGTPLDRAPLDQANRFVRRLVDRLGEAGCSPPAYGAAVCFPDAPFDAPPTQDDLAGVTLGASDLTHLREALPAVVRRALPPPRQPRTGWVDQVHRLWGETWVPSLSLGTRVRALGETRLALDPRQLAVLDVLLENERVLVRGGAGSGKTLVAAEAARREVAAGRTVLLLCSAEPLRRWLAARLGDAGVVVQTVSGLAQAMVESADGRAAASERRDPAAWNDLVRRAAGLAEPRWDTVILDEAQDLQDDAWLLVGALARGRRLWGFHDPGQRFWAERNVPNDLFGTILPLPKGLRCPAGVEALANRIAGAPHDADALARARADGTVAFVGSQTRAAIPDAIADEVRRLLASGLSPGDIGIVSLHGQPSKDPLFALDRIGRDAIVRTDHPEMEDRLVGDSFLRWKGLERPAIVVSVLPGTELLKQSAIRMYVALTRTMMVARLAGTAEDAARYGF